MKFNKTVMAISALLLLASCGGGNTGGGTTSTPSGGGTSTNKGTPENLDISAPIRVWLHSDEQAIAQKAIEQWNAKQTDDKRKFNVTFKNVAESDAGTDFGKDNKVDGQYPSLVALADDQIADLVAKKFIAKLQTPWANLVKEDYEELAVKGATAVADGNIYGFPISADNGYVLAYDADKLSDNDVKTFEGLVAKVKELGATMEYDIGNGFYANSLFTGVAGTDSLSWSLDSDGATSYTINWDTDECARAAESFSELVKPLYADKTLTYGGDAGVATGFGAGGKMVAAITGVWNESALNKTGKNIKAVELPTFGGKHLGSFAGTKQFVVNSAASTKAGQNEQAAAMALGQLLTSKEVQIERFNKRFMHPCLKEAVSDPSFDVTKSVFAEALRKQAAYGASQAASAESRYWNIGAAIGAAMRDGLDTKTYSSWKQFLTSNCELLRKKQK